MVGSMSAGIEIQICFVWFGVKNKVIFITRSVGYKSGSDDIENNFEHVSYWFWFSEFPSGDPAVSSSFVGLAHASETKHAVPMSPVVLGNRGHPELFSDVTCRIPTALLVDAIVRDMLARMSQIQP